MELTQEWIAQYNKKCAEFLGYVSTTPTDPDFDIYEKKGGEVGNLIEPKSCKFHSDWNWIHEVIDKIEQTVYNVRKSDGAEHKFYVWFRKNHCEIWPVWINKEPLKINANSKKEAVIQAIDQFIDWYNKQKES